MTTFFCWEELKPGPWKVGSVPWSFTAKAAEKWAGPQKEFHLPTHWFPKGERLLVSGEGGRLYKMIFPNPSQKWGQQKQGRAYFCERFFRNFPSNFRHDCHEDEVHDTLWRMEALMGGELYSTYQKHTFYGDKATRRKKNKRFQLSNCVYWCFFHSVKGGTCNDIVIWPAARLSKEVVAVFIFTKKEVGQWEHPKVRAPSRLEENCSFKHVSSLCQRNPSSRIDERVLIVDLLPPPQKKIQKKEKAASNFLFFVCFSLEG